MSKDYKYSDTIKNNFFVTIGARDNYEEYHTISEGYRLKALADRQRTTTIQHTLLQNAIQRIQKHPQWEALQHIHRKDNTDER